MTIIPDTKDWTWVLERRCPECGFDTSGFARESVGELLRANTTAWVDVLAAPGAATRPAPTTWSPLEYGCHVRDVFTLYEYRLGLMLSQEDPLFPNWDQDETANQERYGDQNPGEVAPVLVAAGSSLAAAFDAIAPDQWSRPGRRSDGAVFTVETFARYFIHDPVHHLYDATGRPSSSA